MQNGCDAFEQGKAACQIQI